MERDLPGQETGVARHDAGAPWLRESAEGARPKQRSYRRGSEPLHLEGGRNVSCAERTPSRHERLPRLERFEKVNERQHETRPNLQDVLDALPFPSIVIDAEHRVLLANPAAVAALGVGASNCDRRCFELVHCSERPPPDCPLEHAEVSGGPEVVELDQGDDTWVRASVYPLPGLSSTGQRLYLHTLIDTTAEHRSRRTLAESEERYRILAETAQDMIFIIDADDRIEYVNKTAAAQFGLTPEELMGRQRSEVFPRRLAAQQKAELAEVLRSGTPMTTESATRFGDRTAWLSTSLVPLTGDDGAPRAVLGISRDFTSRRNAEEELRATTHRFEELFELSPTISYTEKPTEEGFRTN